jgi:hypothetical protein
MCFIIYALYYNLFIFLEFSGFGFRSLASTKRHHASGDRENKA